MSGAGTDVNDGAAARRCFRWRARACVNKNGAFRFVSIMVSQSSGVVVSRSPRGKQAAAEFTSRSTVPNSRTAASIIFVAAASPSARSTATKARAQISHDGTPDGP